MDAETNTDTHDEARTKLGKTWFSADEHAEVLRVARSRGLRMSAFLRESALLAAKTTNGGAR